MSSSKNYNFISDIEGLKRACEGNQNSKKHYIKHYIDAISKAKRLVVNSHTQVQVMEERYGLVMFLFGHYKENLRNADENFPEKNLLNLKSFLEKRAEETNSLQNI